MKNPSCTRTLPEPVRPVGPTGQTGRSLPDRPQCLDRSDRSVRPVCANFGCQQGFLGLSGYSTKLIRNYALFSKPLTDLLKKHVPFVWTSQHQQCFDILNHALLTAPVLALPDFSKSFQIETDVSAFGIGPVLMQDHHPIAYMSKTLGIKAQLFSTYEKEYLALIMAVTRWKPYLQ